MYVRAFYEEELEDCIQRRSLGGTFYTSQVLYCNTKIHTVYPCRCLAKLSTEKFVKVLYLYELLLQLKVVYDINSEAIEPKIFQEFFFEEKYGVVREWRRHIEIFIQLYY